MNAKRTEGVAPQTTKGWCPTLLTPMESGDGYLARVKPLAARLTAAGAVAIADGAAQYGSGVIELTNRGNLQIRGLGADTFERFAEGVLNLDLANPDPGAEAVRNILVDPLGADDPNAGFDSHGLARQLTALLAEDAAFHALPGKFGLLIDAGSICSLDGVIADIMVRPAGKDLRIDLAGGDVGLCLTREQVASAVSQLLHAFLDWRRDHSDVRRMRYMVAEQSASSVFETADLSGDFLESPSNMMSSSGPPIGFLEISPGGTGAIGLGAPFGQLDATSLKTIAGLAERFADGCLRVTPWKSFLLCGVAADRAGRLLEDASRVGLIVDADDPRRRIVACAGRPRCTSAHVDALADAAFLAGLLPGDDMVHLTACTKACAHPRNAAITLVADAGGYGVVRNGCAGDTPEVEGLTLKGVSAYLAEAAA
jgi:precorrin-3B synthase